jgi:hypothetical protein
MKHHILVVFLLTFCASTADAAVGIVRTAVTNRGAGDQVLFSTLTTGDTVVVGLALTNGGGTITGCSDPTNGAYTLAVTNSDYGGSWIYYKRNITGGSLSVTCVSSDGASSNFSALGAELNGVDNVGTVLTDTLTETSGVTHTCASPGITGDGFFLGVAAMGALATVTPGAGWTQLNDQVDAAAVLVYKSESGSSETYPFTLSTSSGTGCAAAFVPAAAGGGGGGGGHVHRLLMGVG